MKIEEDGESNLVIKPTKQTIDDKLGVPEPFLNKCGVYVVSGGMGSGKSSFLNSVMTANGNGKVYKHIFNKVFYSTPQEVFDSEENHPFKKHNKSRLFFDLSNKTFESIVEQAIAEKDDGGNSMLILDDWSEQLKDRRVEMWLKRLIHKHRHYKLNIMISLLTLKSLPRALRSLVDCYVIFKPKSLIEMGNFSEEVFAMDKKDLQVLFDYVFDEPYNFLFYNQRDNSYYRNFTRLKLKYDENI